MSRKFKTYSSYLPKGGSFYRWNGHTCEKLIASESGVVTWRVRLSEHTLTPGSDFFLGLYGTVWNGFPMKVADKNGRNSRIELHEVVLFESCK